MSDLDDRLIELIEDDQFSPDDKLEKIKELFAANEEMKTIPCVEKEDLINPNHHVSRVTLSYDIEETAAAIAAVKDGHKKILDYLLEKGFSHDQPLYVVCIGKKIDLARADNKISGTFGVQN